MDPVTGALLAGLALLFGLSLLLLLMDARKPHGYPPGPGWVPVLGSFWTVLALVRRTGYTHLAWAQLAKRYGPLVGLRLGRDRIVLVSGQRLVREALARDDFEGRPDGFLFRLRSFGDRLGIVFTDGAFFQEQRRFVLRHLRELGLGRTSMQERIAEEAKEFISCLRVKCKEGPVDVRRIANVCILNNLWAMMAGQRFSTGDQKLSRLLNYIHQSFQMQDMSGGLLNQLPFIRFIAPERSTYNKNIEILTTIYSFLRETIEEHKNTFNPDNVRDFIDAFLLESMQNGSVKDTSFSEKQLLVLLLDLFMAGSDSTSNTLGFAVLYLLHFPHVQDRLRKEVEGVAGARPPSLLDRSSMPYTDAFIMEVLRYTNIATVAIPHRAKRQVTLDNYVIPKDVTLLVSLYSVHMDEAHWGDPHHFRPERFLDQHDRVVHDDWLMPFGFGRRRCLGETMARPMLFMFLTSLVQQFRISVGPDQPLPSLQPVDGAILAPRPFTCLLTPVMRDS